MGVAANFTVASDGAGEDLTIAVTGSTDSSVVISSTGTGADAINIDTTAGSIDIDSADNITVGAADEISITTTSADGHISLVSAHTAGVALHVDADANAGSIVDIDAGILDVDVTGVASIDSGGTLSLATATSSVAVSIGHTTSETTVNDNLNVTGDLDITGGLSFDGGTAVTSIDADMSSVSGSDDTLASAKAIKSYIDSTVTAQDLDATGDSGTIAIDLDSETLTIAGGTGATTVGSGNGITVNVDAAQAGITSVTNAGLALGRDADNQIKFATDDQIIFRVAGADGVTMKASGEIEATSLDIDGDADINGTLEADAITVGGTALNTVIAGVTVTNATNSAHVLVTDNENANEENLITFVEGATDGTGNVGLEMDGHLTYNPSTGTVTSTIFKGNIDAVDGDFDGTLEADAITVGGTNIVTGSLITTLGTVSAGVWNGTVIAETYLPNASPTAEGVVELATSAETITGTDGAKAVTPDGLADWTGGNNAITKLGTIATGVWNGTAVASAYMDVQTAHLDTVQTFTGAKTFSADTTFGVDDTGVDVRLFSATASEGVLYDASEDELALLLTTKLKFHDVGGGEEIFASEDGTLKVNAGAILDETAPIIDLNAATKIIVNSPIMQMFSGTSARPLMSLECTNPDALGGTLQFVKDGASVADNDVVGTIKFVSEDDTSPDPVVQTYATIESTISDMTAGSEGGSISISVASHDGELQPGLTLQDGNAEDEIDVFIANGAASVTTVAGDLTVNGDTTLFTSANSQDPLVQIKNTTNDANGARLQLVKDKGANAADNDVVGVIEFVGDNDAQQQTSLAKIQTEVADASDGAEGGRLLFGVATHDGEMQFGLVIEDGDVEDEIDVITGNGTLSTTTAAGYSKATSGFLIPEAKSIHIETPMLASANLTATGITTLLTASEAIAQGDLVYVSGDGTIGKAVSNDLAKLPAIGLAVAAISNNQPGAILLQGMFRNDAYGFTAGNRLYVHTDATITATAPSGNNQGAQAIGVALEPDVVYFNPSMVVVEITA